MERIPAGRFAAGCAVAGLSAIAVVLFLRRIAVETLRDLPAGEAAAYAVGFSLAGFVSVRSLSSGAEPRGRGLGDAAVVLLTITFAAGLTTDAVSVLACLIASGMAVGIAASGLGSSGADIAAGEGTGSPNSAGTAGPTASVGSGIAEPGSFDGSTSSEENPRPEEPRASLVRSIHDGTESLEGLIRFEIPAGETVQVLHVPVWPPLAGEPAVTCDLEEIEGRVRVPVAKSHGFRIEVRVPEAIDEPLAGAVRFAATGQRKAA